MKTLWNKKVGRVYLLELIVASLALISLVITLGAMMR